MVGIPVVWNHSGTEVSLITGLSFSSIGMVLPSQGKVGTVVDSWVSPDGAGRAIIKVVGKALISIVGSPAAGSVSLTHLEQNTPYELSIVSKPARPGSVVERPLNSPRESFEYKERAGTSMYNMSNMEVDTAAPAKTPIELALESVPNEENRNRIAARMTEMARHAVDSSKKAEKLERELADFRQMDKSAMQATKNAIDMWIKSLGPDVSCRWNVDKVDGIGSADTGVNWQTMRNVVMASHDRIMELQSGKRPSPATRKSTEEPEAPPAQRHKSEPTHAPPTQDPLALALAENFEPSYRL